MSLNYPHSYRLAVRPMKVYPLETIRGLISNVPHKLNARVIANNIRLAVIRYCEVFGAVGLPIDMTI